jgi:Na+/H+ antiporter NhaD/arsenite permease-like protein
MSPNPIFTMIIFVLIIFVILRQPKIKLPGSTRIVQLDYGSAPLLGVLILLFAQQIDTQILIVGVLGTATIKPVMIIMLFFSLAYVCISIDLTGFFAYLSLTAAKKSGSSGKKLFFYFFLLSSVLTTFTSNDIVILTLTPIIVYFCKYTKTNPVPYLIGQFFAANIWSIALYVGNPTNIIVAQAYNLTFLGYSQWMVLPTAVAGISSYFLVLKSFKNDIPNKITPPEIDPKSALKDRFGAVFGMIMLITNLILLSLAPIFGWNMGYICLIFAIIFLVRDFIHDLRNPYKEGQQKTVNSLTDDTNVSNKKPSRFDTPLTALSRMPWKIMPFVFGMFIMVEVMGDAGLIEIFASGIASVVNKIGLVPSVFFMTFLSSLVCNITNNQPMTILFTRILQDGAFTTSDLLTRANMFALIMGSNFGANFTLIGALAGIMWSSISEAKGIKITYKSFAKQGFKIMPIVVALASLVLALEFVFWG